MQDNIQQMLANEERLDQISENAENLNEQVSHVLNFSMMHHIARIACVQHGDFHRIHKYISVDRWLFPGARTDRFLPSALLPAFVCDGGTSDGLSHLRSTRQPVMLSCALIVVVLWRGVVVVYDILRNTTGEGVPEPLLSASEADAVQGHQGTYGGLYQRQY